MSGALFALVLWPLSTAHVGVYASFWAVGRDGVNTNDFEPDASGALRPVLGTNAAIGLDAPVSQNLSLSVLLGIDYFTAGYPLGVWVSQGGLFTTYGSANINLWL
ncbi:MAG: hypothetical protein GWP91_04570 [Rhodobacterales bacterium]|nr:hypothetical protein [Rhodobacterales bacterium]